MNGKLFPTEEFNFNEFFMIVEIEKGSERRKEKGNNYADYLYRSCYKKKQSEIVGYKRFHNINSQLARNRCRAEHNDVVPLKLHIVVASP